MCITGDSVCVCVCIYCKKWLGLAWAHVLEPKGRIVILLDHTHWRMWSPLPHGPIIRYPARATISPRSRINLRLPSRCSTCQLVIKPRVKANNSARFPATHSLSQSLTHLPLPTYNYKLLNHNDFSLIRILISDNSKIFR